jgi:PAS domain S-box-containing protein
LTSPGQESQPAASPAPASPAGAAPARVQRSRSLRVYLIGLVILFTAAAGANFWYQRGTALSQARRNAVADARFASALGAKNIATAIAQVRGGAETTAKTPNLATILSGPGSCTLAFDGAGPFTSGHIDVVSSGGAVDCSSLAGARAQPYHDARWLPGALAKPSLTGPVTDARTGKPSLVAGYPIPGQGPGGVKGTVVVFLDLDALGPSLTTGLGGPLHLGFAVTTRDTGEALASSADPSRWVGARLRGTAFARSGGQTEHADLEGVPSLFGRATAPGLGWQVFAGVGTARALAAANDSSERDLIINLIGLAVFLAALWVIYRQVTRPISKLSEEVRAATAHTGSAPITVRGPAEVSTLVEDFNQLIAAADRELDVASRLAAIVESSADAIIGTTIDGVITSWNSGAERMYGYTAQEMIGRGAVATLVPPDRAGEMESLLAELRRGNQVGLLETRRLHKDGSVLDVAVHLSPLRAATGEVTGLCSVSRDITERNRAEAERRALQGRLRRFERVDEQERELRLLADRDRIARDLHDTVIQQVFATGLALASASQLISEDVARRRVDKAVSDLDGVGRQIRNVIFAAQSAQSGGVRSAVLTLTREATRVLGFEPTVVFTGPVETMIPDYVADQLLATLRESLSNVARHASARWAEVKVAVDDDIALTVADDGVGLHSVDRAGGLGLANMQARAEQLGGRFTAQPRNGGGTHLDWRVPLPDPASHANIMS